ncbi:MAG: ATP phosphoribosyltransferase [Gammaproteobacteria bacterium]|nr:ATP phosphoribosyltransferase [Gammaproteobacteria bacterium]NIN62829.1 ATP phosphoribosyltransferase [Gammaproteobacteria bacterium]NIO63810.1 ATP phosphoribosyltransferase [Gammaproteobacteria bacterium]NIP50188.1 ATP phosphoribosyltransferase [Gammaproteobacteria bacterium]NIQ12406.1 ATP phosphoribosyltransferase [Gammaproteobacteria bacterium]
MNRSHNLTIAVSKGRILTEALPLLTELGIRPVEAPEQTRKLILETAKPGIKLVVVRATDVPTYVEYGAADLGIAGKDVLLEYGGKGLYEPVDLKIARCKMVLAGPKKEAKLNRRLRVATKYIKTTRDYFASRGEQVEIIKLYGSMELAPLLGLADRIVDLIDTGNTLKANGLVPLELITWISSRLIVNTAAMKMKHELIKPIINQLEQLCK